MYSDILEKIKTQKELREVDEEIDTLLDALFEVDEKVFTEVLKSKTKAWLAHKLSEAFEKGREKEDYLRGLKKELEKIKSLKITLGFEPSLEIIENIHSWVWKNVGKNIVLDISFNPSILGGTVISFEGNYRDYSLRRKLTDHFDKEKESVLNKLNKAG